MAYLSKRLQAVADFVPQGARLLDVGSDHAYLPLYLTAQGRIDFAVAGEVVPGPYQIALANVAAAGRSDQITVRLADGLAAMSEADAIDTVVIAGMGGGLIADILTAGRSRLSAVRRLILQPNNREDLLRTWLSQNGFQIYAENILEEAGKFYELMAVQPGQQELTDQEIRFGPCLMAEQSPVFRKRWSRDKAKLEAVRQQIPSQKAAERAAISQKIQAIEEVLHVSE